MATEQEYDEIIAPMLLEIARKCEELGMSIIARVEWQPDKVGITQLGFTDDTGIGQKMTQLAAHSHGNIDLFCMEAMRRYDCSKSAILFPYRKADAPNEAQPLPDTRRKS